MEPRQLDAIVVVGFSAPMLGFARRVAPAGVRVHVVDLVRAAEPFARASSAVDPLGITMEWSRVGTPEGLQTLREFARRTGSQAILTKDDWALTWLGENRGYFEPEIRILAPDPAILGRLLDKGYQTGRAREAGFETLPSWLLESEDSIGQIPEDSYPVVARPSRPFSAHPEFKADIFASRDELTARYRQTRWTAPPIVQPFCLGPNYVLHGMRAADGQVTALRLFRACRKHGGFAVSLAEDALPEPLARAATRFVEREGLTGPFHFDLLRREADGRFFYLELNCRLGGTTVRVIPLGYDEPGLLLEAFALRTPRPLAPLRAAGRVTSFSLNLQQAADELRGRHDPLAYPQFRRWQSVAASLAEACTVRDPLFSWRDPLFTLRYARWKARG